MGFEHLHQRPLFFGFFFSLFTPFFQKPNTPIEKKKKMEFEGLDENIKKDSKSKILVIFSATKQISVESS